MAPSTITEDFYAILEVDPSSTLDQITTSYRRLALKLHPDRNPQQNAKEAFQLLGQAYETLKDETKRRDYDTIHHSNRGRRRSLAHSMKTSHQRHRPASRSPSPISFPKCYTLSELSEILALKESKQKRLSRWRSKKLTFEIRISNLQDEVRKLEEHDKHCDDVVAAAIAEEEAKTKSWTIWLLSSLSKKRGESEKDEEVKRVVKEEREFQRDMRERELLSKTAETTDEQGRLKQAKQEFIDANRVDDHKMWKIEATARVRIERERQERDRGYKRSHTNANQEWQDDYATRHREAAEVNRRQEEKEERRSCAHTDARLKASPKPLTCPECGDIFCAVLGCPDCGLKSCVNCMYKPD